MKVVPQILYHHDQVRKILVDGLNAVVHKTLDTIDTETSHYVAAPVLAVVLQGQLQLHAGDEVIRVDHRKIALIPKGEYLIADVLGSNKQFEALFFFFDADVINAFLEEATPRQQQQSPNCLLECTYEIRQYAKNLIHLFENKPTMRGPLAQHKLIELLHYIHQHEGNKILGLLESKTSEARLSVKELMEKHFDKPLNVQDFVLLSGRSEATFRRDFKRLYGLSPKRWLINKRMELARNLLKNTDQTVSQIALQIGYDSVSHFTHRFVKEVGTSPKQYAINKRLTTLK